MGDNQGPFNLVSEIIGRDIYLEVYDHANIVLDILKKITDISIDFVKWQKNLIGEPFDSHYNFQYRLTGGIRICEDNGLSLSPEHYEKFCKPFNEKLFAEFGGGVILLCGPPHHLIDNILETKGLKGIIYWSSDENDLIALHKKAAKKKVGILWYGEVPEKLESQPNLTGIVVKVQAKTLEEAREIMAKATGSK